MGRNNYFQFKQFRIIQNKTAMKVGTDGILLGAWVNAGKENTVLDVGTGTGLISLMMAQRTLAQVTGIEIEKNAADEAVENISASPWNSRISIQHISFQNYIKSASKKFDLIISNPPFFTNGIKPDNNNLAMAKHNDLLSISDLIIGSLQLLNNEGRLALIFPVVQAQKTIEIANSKGLFLNRLTKIKPTPKKEINRFLMEFGKIKSTLETNDLTIYDKTGISYSAPFKELTKNFYLKF